MCFTMLEMSYKTSESSVNKENKQKISTCSPLFHSFPKSKVYATLLCTIQTRKNMLTFTKKTLKQVIMIIIYLCFVMQCNTKARVSLNVSILWHPDKYYEQRN